MSSDRSKKPSRPGPDLVNETLWAARPEAVEALAASFARAEAPGREWDSPPETREPYSLNGGVAVIPVMGGLSKHGYFWGGTEYDQLRSAVSLALADHRVKAVLLDMDSPGGTVAGCRDLAGFLAACGRNKPLYAYTDGQMCSGAYWLASQCKEIAAASTAQVGSIGVVALHMDYSAMAKEQGVKPTYLTAGKFKAFGASFLPLTEESQNYLQGNLDQVYAVFLQDVARGRRASAEKTLAMADGKVFVGEKALAAGLVDRLASRDEFITSIKERSQMNLTEFRAQHPDLAAQAAEEARAGLLSPEQAQKQAGEAAQGEKSRVMGLAAAVLGDEAAAKLQAVVDAGLTPEQVSALKGVFASPPAPGASEDQARAEVLEAMKAAHGQGVSSAQPPAGQPKPEQWKAMVDAHKAEHKCSASEAMAAIEKQHPGLRQAYLDNQNGSAKK